MLDPGKLPGKSMINVEPGEGDREFKGLALNGSDAFLLFRYLRVLGGVDLAIIDRAYRFKHSGD